MSKDYPIAEIRTMANSVTKSGMFGIKNAEQAFTLMLIAEAEGIHPIQAVQQYHVIQGLPSLKSTEVQSRFQKDGGKIKWIETTNKHAICELSHPMYDGTYKSEFTEEDARLEGLLDKDNYKKRPKAMYMARAMTRGVRAVAPSCLNNIYSVEEIQDLPVQEDIEQIEECEIVETDINDLKRKLTKKLEELSFVNADIKEFATKFNLAEDIELLEKLVNDDELLNEKVKEFEDEQ